MVSNWARNDLIYFSYLLYLFFAYGLGMKKRRGKYDIYCVSFLFFLLVMYAYCLCMLFYNVSMVRFMNSCQDIGFSSLLQSISILKLGELKSFMLCVCCMSSGSDLKARVIFSLLPKIWNVPYRFIPHGVVVSFLK